MVFMWAYAVSHSFGSDNYCPGIHPRGKRHDRNQHIPSVLDEHVADRRRCGMVTSMRNLLRKGPLSERSITEKNVMESPKKEKSLVLLRKSKGGNRRCSLSENIASPSRRTSKDPSTEIGARGQQDVSKL
ncbi:hypothetical protein SKAU_G00321570 [Synaphobranchus kaupii]|uniref:Uncharacterized protein n=1 Tax=Synaphobranchus kaupii TaxID=118154 RepID=A0A9Q1ENU8_SYNKA|nr:hypothetical protein SKAU_G00321570 [Synaphobranchus kaupii]